jgi:hypothetical protein
LFLQNLLNDGHFLPVTASRTPPHLPMVRTRGLQQTCREVCSLCASSADNQCRFRHDDSFRLLARNLTPKHR